MMLSKSTRMVRNLAVSLVNGIITLIILLIAPLGLLAVITNTVLITFSTYFLLSLSDKILIRLFGTKEQRLIEQQEGSLVPWIQGQITKQKKD
jgi:hypothetical protein